LNFEFLDPLEAALGVLGTNLTTGRSQEFWPGSQQRGEIMTNFKYLAFAAMAGIFILAAPQKSQAQVSFGVQIGPEPACPYGYFDYPPYQCAPYGYYGPEWFRGGTFFGAGPWFHGPDHFRGHIDSHFDPRRGYRGHLPDRGEHADWDSHHGRVEHFKGRDYREERGHHDDEHHNGGH
jgi:hypothetical protein